eukprot:240301-Amphidinium_carterae.1
MGCIAPPRRRDKAVQTRTKNQANQEPKEIVKTKSNVQGASTHVVKAQSSNDRHPDQILDCKS